MSDRPMSHLCSEPIRADLKAYLDHELAPLARLRVWRHLKTCARCAEELTMLQAAHERLVTAMPDEIPSDELRGRIWAQIEQSGLVDERIRNNPGRSGLIPRRVLPVVAVASVMVTAMIVYALVHPRLMAQLRVGQDRRQIGLASTQYAQDYDEKFSALKTTNPPTSGMGWETSPQYKRHPQTNADFSYSPNPPLIIGLRTAHPDAAMDALMATYSDSSLFADDTEITIYEMPSRQITRLVPDLQKIGTPDLAQIRRVLRVSEKHPGASLDITIHILPEAAR